MQRYEKYKDSRIDWLGKIPVNWETEKGKWLFIKNERPVLADYDVITCFRDGEVTLRKNRREDGFTNSLKEIGYQGVLKGDLVIHQMDAFAGAIGVSDSDGKSTPVYSVCSPRVSNVSNYFYAYYLRSMALAGVISSLAKGIRERSTDFRFNDFSNLIYPLPPISEQEAIAKFLDDKCEKIDAAITLKEQQIEKLKELRQITIHNAVTKGIMHFTGKVVRMKDSGIDWIGEIPEHWEVKRLKNVLIERNERSQSGTEPLFMMSQIHGLVLRKDYHEKEEVAKSAEGNKVVYQNDLVFNKLKPHLGVFYKNKLDTMGIVSPDYAVYYSDTLDDIIFLEYLFRIPEYISQFKIRATGIVEGLIRLYTSDLFSIHVAIPPPSEQREIITYLENQTSKIDKAIAQKQEQIIKLKEYKQSLINEVVTGKIMVTL